jgi:hypothetical protein
LQFTRPLAFARGVPASRLRFARALRRSALKSVVALRVFRCRSRPSDGPIFRFADVPHPHMIHRHDDGTEEWMAFFKDNDGRPLGVMSQAKP